MSMLEDEAKVVIRLPFGLDSLPMGPAHIDANI